MNAFTDTIHMATLVDAAWGTPQVLDSIGDVGRTSSLAIIAWNAAISYYDQASNDLKWVTINSTVSLSISEGSLATQTGTFSDVEGNATVTLTASSGALTHDNGAGPRRPRMAQRAAK